jgi:RNA polymerase sigma-70 factor, ECF subfamily
MPDPSRVTEDESAHLVKRIASRDKAALELLYKRHGSIALALAKRIVGRMSEAEDVVQEAFVEIWRRADQFDARRGSAEAWTYGIVRNRAIDRVRKHSVRQRTAQEAANEREPASVSPLEEAQRREERLAVAHAVSSIPKEQREALELAYFEGLSHSEIAARTGAPLGTIKTRIRSAMEKLGLALSAFSGEGT